MIRVLTPGIYSSVQDQGRIGFAKLGIPISGVMDSYSARMANMLLKNKQGAAVIEIAFGGAKFEFVQDCFICITGADFSPRLNDVPIEMSTVCEVKKGNVLSFGKRKFGVRTYVAVQGGIQTEQILKSRSIFEGPDFEGLNKQQKKRLFEPFTISEDNNRVGYRLHETIENNLKPILTSAVLPGTVQLTPSGTLIVLMRDAQVTGGYPRVLQLTSFSVDILSQMITGNSIKFGVL